MEKRITKVFILKGYKYRLEQKIELNTPFVGYSAEIKNATDIFAEISTNGQLIVYPGYAWDGMTGWFESLKTIMPSLIHDVLYQFIAVEGSKIPREKYVHIADKYFMKLLKKNEIKFWIRFLIKQGIRFGNARSRFKYAETEISYIA